MRNLDQLLYVGSYTNGVARCGITSFIMDRGSGNVLREQPAARIADASFLSASPDGKRLYAVSESQDLVVAFEVERETGTLSKLTEQAVAGIPGQQPCHLAILGESMLAVANYGGGSVSLFPLSANQGILPLMNTIKYTGQGPNRERQSQPHPHGVSVTPDRKFAFFNDLGTDSVHVYRIGDDDVSLRPVARALARPGAGPRHGVHFEHCYYCVNEMASTVAAFRWDAATGTLAPGATVSTLPEGTWNEKWTAAEIQACTRLGTLYISNRGHDSVAVFKIVDTAAGRLELLQISSSYVKNPRHLTLTPDSRYLLICGQDSDELVVCRIEADGTIAPPHCRASVSKPACAVFLP
jgi:6-phosphogluconolactonase